jgi:hypothetical protein
MAVYFLRCTNISRSKGSRATRAAAYRAGERIRNHATSEVFDYRDRSDIDHKEIVLPSDLRGRADMAWAEDRSTLWNAAEHAGTRRNSRLAREWLVFLPPELDPDQRRQLVQSFATELADRYRAAVDACIHRPRPGADPRNNHAHLMMTTREVTPDGLGPRTRLEVSGRQRYLLGIPGSSRAEYLGVRALWADLTNRALERAGRSERVDHRSYKDRGIDREPRPTIPEGVFYAERAGRTSAAGDAIRARHKERLDARIAGDGALEKTLETQRANLRKQVVIDKAQQQSTKRPYGSLTREQRNAYRRDYYRKLKEREKSDPALVEKRRAASRRSYYLQKQKNPGAILKSRRRWRLAHSSEINRKQREHRNKNKESVNEKRRLRRAALKATHSREPEVTPPAQPRPLDAQSAAERWKAQRSSLQNTGLSAAESAQRWLKYRESQQNPSSSRDRGPHTSKGEDDLDRGSQKKRERTGPDFEL